MKRSTRENVGIALAVAISIALYFVARRNGMPQKWHAAIIGTTAPFLVAVLSYRLRWSRWSFWASVAICLAVHTLAVWIFFQYVLLNVRYVGTLFWYPVALVETFVLLVAVKRVEESLTGKQERIRAS